MKLVIVGGHLSPALAVLEALPKDAQVLFIGRKYPFEGDRATTLEYNTIRDLKIPFVSILTGRLQRRFTQHTIPSFFKIPYGFIQSFFILRDFKPDVVLSFGGYLSIPVGLSAFFLRIPIVIHEQTLEAGLSNRILSFFANKICISWESSRKYFPKSKTILTGNPLRKYGRHSGNPDLSGASRISKVERDSGQARLAAALGEPRLWRDAMAKRASMTALYDMSKKLPIIYITGGSAGSHFINTLVEGCIKELLEKFVVIHQTGDAQEYRDFDRLSDFKDSLAARLKARYHLVKFVQPQEVGSVLERVDLVVGRSGINTVTELIFFKKPSLLIPLPYSGNNEQIKNALFLKDKGLGEIFYQNTLDSKKFLHFIEEMFNNIERYKIRKPASPASRRGVQRGEPVQAFGSEDFGGELSRTAQARRDDKGNAVQKIVEVIYNEAKIK